MAIRRNLYICSPEYFWSLDTQRHICAMRRGKSHDWIFNLIRGCRNNIDELIYIDEDEWMLCKDVHVGCDIRYLVIFKDPALHTIRNLSSEHVRMLLEIQKRCRQFLQGESQDVSWRMYFNYQPSVMQLHLHIAQKITFSSNRVHPLACVIRNIQACSDHYKNALILGSRLHVAKQRSVY